MPIVTKVKGKETIDSVIEKIEDGALTRLEQNLIKSGFIGNYPTELILVAFKEDRIFQVFGKDDKSIRFIKEYPFTAYSGELGPKLKEGDRQIPEGIYMVESLNPNSSFYLSIKVNYPNKFDQSKTKFSSLEELGSDIFIHGKAATIGCIPIGDEAIEEVFLLTQKSIKNNIKVIISPQDFRTKPVYPEIENIDWEEELYDIINKELKKLPYQEE